MMRHVHILVDAVPDNNHCRSSRPSSGATTWPLAAQPNPQAAARSGFIFCPNCR